ncbi:MAG: hypothetical protein JWL59_3465 [Chthoniobacteraceae bacterium]|nr:hypothetical protein [Chthoniobacteraceae bacterium]
MREFELQYPGGPLITQGVQEPVILQLQESISIKRRDMRTGWVWYTLPSFPDAGISLIISLGFVDGFLREISIAHDDTTLYGRGWDDWSEEKEILRAENTAKWFKKKGFELGTFSWGSIWASYDPKGGFGSGGVRYTET